jgi:uncharacterized membrane protein YkoI
MNMQSIRWVLVGVLLALLATAPMTADAQRPGVEPQGFAPPSSTVQRSRVSLEQAAETVARATGGRILDAKQVGAEYRIKVLTRKGEVRVLYVNAETGAIRE